MAAIHNNPHRGHTLAATSPPGQLIGRELMSRKHERGFLLSYSWIQLPRIIFHQNIITLLTSKSRSLSSTVRANPMNELYVLTSYNPTSYILLLLSALTTTFGVVKRDLFWNPSWECVYFNLKWLLTTLNLCCSVCDGWYLWYLWGREKTDMFTLQCKYKEKHLDWDWATSSYWVASYSASLVFLILKKNTKHLVDGRI